MSCEHCEHCERSDFTGDLRASLRACECECHDIARRFGSLPKLTSGVKS